MNKKLIILTIITVSVFVFGNLYSKDDAKINRGKAVYSATCVACHQATGKGLPNAFPPLAGSDFLNKDINRAIKFVKFGFKGPITVNGVNYNLEMVKPNLTDDQIADVLTFVTNTWGNKPKDVTKAQVAKVKQ
ncbi:MAG: cytochrome c [Candidatus Kapabacteria bacterium]|nr:cytochrome c [Candidatus Kapabacteria bacterium]